MYGSKRSRLTITDRIQIETVILSKDSRVLLLGQFRDTSNNRWQAFQSLFTLSTYKTLLAAAHIRNSSKNLIYCEQTGLSINYLSETAQKPIIIEGIYSVTMLDERAIPGYMTVRKQSSGKFLTSLGLSTPFIAFHTDPRPFPYPQLIEAAGQLREIQESYGVHVMHRLNRA